MDETRTWRSVDLALAFASAAMITYGVLVLDWSVFIVIALFWLENVVIGIFNVARMLISGVRLGRVGLIAALALSAFFTVHYGMFTVVHGVFVVMLFGQPELGGSMSGLFGPLVRMVDYLLADREAWFAAVGITLLQATAFFRWTIASRAHPAVLPALMFAPYGRIMILHFTVIASGLLVAMLKLPVLGALLLVGLKLVFDIVAVNSGGATAGSTKPVPVRRFIISQEEDATRP